MGVTQLSLLLLVGGLGHAAAQLAQGFAPMPAARTAAAWPGGAGMGLDPAAVGAMLPGSGAATLSQQQPVGGAAAGFGGGGAGMLPGLMQQPQATAAAPAAAPRRPRLAPGQCAVSFAPAQQCGGNLTGTLYNCSMFDSCDNTAWAGGCCPAAAPCMTLSNAGGWCQTCGGKPPAALVSASKAAGEAPTMCNQMGPNGDFDYGCVLGASLLFYEAQRSGKLPANNRIKWRGNTGLNDRAPNGASIAGGWYDAGDMTKFTFPIAYTVSTLVLALTEFPDAFNAEGRAESLVSSLRWAANWLMAARYAPDSLVAVTWAPGESIKQSHNWWGRPEEVREPAQVRAVRGQQRGADLLASAAAALAAVSVVYQQRDAGYSEELLDVARGLFTQATDSRGFYSDTVPEVKTFYQSYSFMDDLAWGAAWLATRTRDADDIANAQFFFNQHIEMEGGGDRKRFDYNNVLQGAGYLLAKLDPPRKDVWSRPMREGMNIWLKAQQNITYTPKGMAWMDSWGNLRYVANQAFMALLHNKLYPDLSRRVAVYTCFARKQARVMLGETGRSYVVGVGNNPPCRPHHRGASCGPSVPGGLPCDCTALYNEGCNPNTLYGALVGGPNKEDKFDDARTDFAASEVTLDWNAGFTGMLAGLASARVSWDDCKSQRLQDGRGDVPSTLTSGAGAARLGCAWWQLLAAAWAAAALMAPLLLQQHW